MPVFSLPCLLKLLTWPQVRQLVCSWGCAQVLRDISMPHYTICTVSSALRSPEQRCAWPQLHKHTWSHSRAGAEETTVNPCYPLCHLQEKLARRLLGLQHSGLQKEMDNLIIKRGNLLKKWIEIFSLYLKTGIYISLPSYDWSSHVALLENKSFLSPDGFKVSKVFHYN